VLDHSKRLFSLCSQGGVPEGSTREDVRLVARPLKDPEVVAEGPSQAPGAAVVPLDQDLQIVDVLHRSARVDTHAWQAQLDPLALARNLPPVLGRTGCLGDVLVARLLEHPPVDALSAFGLRRGG
jgi:hypothetical protein